MWIHGFSPGHPLYGPPIQRGFGSFFPLNVIGRAQQLRADLGDDILRHAMEPISSRMGHAVTHFVYQTADGDAESIAHSLSELWLTSSLRDPRDKLIRAYRRCVIAVTGRSWGRAMSAASRPALTLLLNLLIGDVGRLPPRFSADQLGIILDSEQFRAEHLSLVAECVSGMAPAGEADARIQADVLRLLIDRLEGVSVDGWDALSQLKLWLVLVELGRPEVAFHAVGGADVLLGSPQVRELMSDDRALRLRVRGAVRRAV